MTERTADERIRVHIEDHTGNRRREARIVSNAAVNQVTPAIVGALKLPATDNNGRPVTYHLAYESRQMQGDETLAGAGVQDGSTLTLVPEMTAGK